MRLLITAILSLVISISHGQQNVKIVPQTTPFVLMGNIQTDGVLNPMKIKLPSPINGDSILVIEYVFVRGIYNGGEAKLQMTITQKSGAHAELILSTQQAVHYVIRNGDSYEINKSAGQPSSVAPVDFYISGYYESIKRL
jgi:hypothetical protein